MAPDFHRLQGRKQAGAGAEELSSTRAQWESACGAKGVLQAHTILTQMMADEFTLRISSGYF